MMDNKSFELLKDATVAVAKEAYEDTAAPVLKPTGQTLGLIPRAVKAALLPLEKWIIGREYNLAEVKKLLELKLQNVSPEQIEEPEAYIAVPALQNISYCMDSEELRDMYAELLAKSMNKATRDGVHPSFVEIIKQLCPDEAKILRFMDDYMPMISLWGKSDDGKSEIFVLRKFSNITELAKCEQPNNVSQYIDNMERLGLVNESPVLSSLADKTVYEPLRNHSKITAHKNVRMQEAYFYLSDFGKAFKQVCIPSAVA